MPGSEPPQHQPKDLEASIAPRFPEALATFWGPPWTPARVAPAVTWLRGCVASALGPAELGVTFCPAGQGLSVPHCLAMTGLWVGFFFLFLSKRINRPRNCSREDPPPSHRAAGGSVGKGSENKIQTGLDPEGRLLGSGWRPAACLCPGTIGLWVEREPKLDQGRPFPIRLSRP